MSVSNGSSRSVSKEIGTETARKLRALEQSHEQLASRVSTLSDQVAKLLAQPTPGNNLQVTGTQAFILRNRS